jgi:hypothetical protein
MSLSAAAAAARHTSCFPVRGNLLLSCALLCGLLRTRLAILHHDWT